MSDLPIPLAIADGRRAITRMYIDLTLAFHASIYPPGKAPAEPDCNLVLVAVAVMLGHTDRPMTASEIAKQVQMPRSTVISRLKTLMQHGLVQRIEHKYYIEPVRAAGVPHRDRFELILSEAFAKLGPLLSESDK